MNWLGAGLLIFFVSMFAITGAVALDMAAQGRAAMFVFFLIGDAVLALYVLFVADLWERSA